MSENAQSSSTNPGSHPDHGLLERFMRGDVLAQEKRRVVRHLLRGCPRCMAVTRSIWALAGGRPVLAGFSDQDVAFPALPALLASPASHVELKSYDHALDRALDAGRRREEQMAVEQEAAPELLAQLLAQPWEKRLALVRRKDRYQTVAEVIRDFFS